MVNNISSSIRSIDIASFTCGKCGHRSTPPEAINAMPNQMDVYAMIEPQEIIKESAAVGGVSSAPITVPLPPPIITLDVDSANQKANRIKLDLEKKMPSNSISVITAGNGTRVVRIARSYAKATFDKTVLEESDHIVLNCPNCNQLLYEVFYK